MLFNELRFYADIGCGVAPTALYKVVRILLLQRFRSYGAILKKSFTVCVV
jgi:hypothetical protein